MSDYLEKILHRNSRQVPYDELKNLPLSCKNVFDLNILKTDQSEFLVATPKETMNLTELRKARLQLEKYTGYPCAFDLKQLNWYSAPKMVEEGIPFIWEDHQVILPAW